MTFCFARRLVFCIAVAATLLTGLARTSAAEADRPNVLWIYVEDMNAWMSCYGDQLGPTPTIDALARRGVKFTRAFMPAGVCSATRSALITGTMQTTFGLHNHRSARASFRGKSMGPDFDDIKLPKGARAIPQLMKEAGYFTFNQGKTDYNFVYDSADLYDVDNGTMGLRGNWKHWRKAKPGQPFFGQIQLRGGKNSGRVKNPTDPADVTVMPYYPDHPIIRKEIAHHYDCIRQTDAEVKQILAALKDDGLLDDTVVFFFTDHGFRGMRHKQFLYDGGIHVPLVVAGPKVPQGKVRDDVVSGIDISIATLALGGMEIPKYAEGRDLFAADHQPRKYIIAARDRCDYTIDRIRAVRTPRFKYLKNFLTDRPYLQPQYRDGRPYMEILKKLYKEGKLNEVQAAFVGPDRPAEELYDVENDPHETVNLAGDPKYAQVLQEHRAILTRWIKDTDDQGQYPESDAGLLCVLKRWGKKCVNPEYDRVREK